MTSLREIQFRQDPAAGEHFRQAKLTTFLTADAVDVGASTQASDWETRCRSWANYLRLSESELPSPIGFEALFQPAGPRYLLGSEDRPWAIHEVVSALEAMDCPVEPHE